MVNPEEQTAEQQQQQQQQENGDNEEQQQQQQEEDAGDNAALLPQSGDSVPMVEIKSGSAAAAADNNGEVEAATVKSKPAVMDNPDDPIMVGLTKEQLDEVSKDPFWRKIRIVVFVLFWVVWVCMLAAVVLIIVISPRCPPREKREFWQKPFYRIQVRSFAPTPSADSNQTEQQGTLSGFESKLNYLRSDLNIDNFLLDSLIQGASGTQCITDFSLMDSKLGTAAQLEALTKRGRRKGFNIMMEIDLSQAAGNWSDKEADYMSEKTAFAKMFSRDGKNWASGRMRIPNSACYTLNVRHDAVRLRLQAALSVWLDRGLSGFMLTNVAYLSPKLTNEVPPSSQKNASLAYLFNDESVAFVKQIRKFMQEESDKRGKPLALFVDAGDLGYQAPHTRLQLYSQHADAVLNTALGDPLAAAAGSTDSRDFPSRVAQSITIGSKATIAHCSNWYYLKRQPAAAITAIMLTIPGIPIVYYGQEIGMQHVSNVQFKPPAASSYLKSSESTDQSQTPMQWSGPSASAGWLSDPNQPLAWVDLSARAEDIRLRNLQRLSSSGHPASSLQLVQQLVAMVNKYESLQWGKVHTVWDKDSVIGVVRKATGFPPVLVIVSKSATARTLSLTDSYRELIGDEGVLQFIDSSGADNAFEVEESFSFSSLYVPANAVLVFVGKAD